MRIARCLAKGPLAHGRLEYALALLVPLATLSVTFALRGVYPFGDLSVCIDDMDLQYLGLFSWLGRVMRGQDSLLHSFSQGIGGNGLALFAYYLSSPLNVLMYAFDPTQSAAFLSLMVLIKVSLAGLTCYVFLRKRYGAGAMSLVLSTAYALCGYAIGQASNIMWLDGFYMLPLVTLGVWRLVHDRSCTLLFCTVLYATLANWYSSYMDCVFSLVYLIACLVAKRDGRPRELALRYAVTMALALGATAALFLPSALNLLAGAESGFGLKVLINPKPIIMPLHLPAFFGIGAKVEMGEAIVPYLFTSALALVLAVFALVRPGLSRRRRLALIILVAAPLLGCMLEGPMTIWSCLRYASSFYFRHSYTVSFALVICAREGYAGLRELSSRQRVRLLGVISAALAVCVELSQLLVDAKGSSVPGIPARVAEVTCLLVLPLLAGFLIGSREPAAEEQISLAEEAASSSHARGSIRVASVSFAAALCALVAIEGGYNAWLLESRFSNAVSMYAGYLGDIESTYEQIKADARSSDKVDADALLVGQARIGYKGDRAHGAPTTCEGFVTGTQQMSEYTSVVRGTTETFMQALGYTNGCEDIFGYSYNSPMLLADTLLGMDYVINDEAVPGSKADAIASLHGFSAYRYQDLLPAAYGLSTTATGTVTWGSHALRNQEALFADATGVGGTYIAAQVTDATEDPSVKLRTLSITCKGDGPLYLYFPGLSAQTRIGSSYTRYTLTANGRALQDVGGRFGMNVVYAGTYSKGDEVTLIVMDTTAQTIDRHFPVAIDSQGSELLWTSRLNELLEAGTLDMDAYAAGVSALDSGLRSACFCGNTASIDFYASRDETLFLRIGYDTGWSATVDGEPATLRQLYTAFLGLSVGAGSHHIELSFEPPGLRLGVVVSVISILAFVGWRVAARRRDAR